MQVRARSKKLKGISVDRHSLVLLRHNQQNILNPPKSIILVFSEETAKAEAAELAAQLAADLAAKIAATLSARRLAASASRKR